ncbi:Inner membrane transport permease YbhS [Rubripirellula tenax]|uniref:Inner membrane transport permease YbhS n=1 Tax=Rubripirellula tenax TaxID=2528015 RepID=A0A5C6FEV6_9BACT|nr:ABC transporter permease [Rubripirellula tenax]TWU59928.1 Inner membrane transport permease YbhS [Rubripirellula tenax]
MNWLRTTWLIARKDLRLYFRDRMALLLGFLLPISLVTVFGFVFGQGNGSDVMPRVSLWIADKDQTDASANLIESLRSSEMLRVMPNVDQKIDVDGITCKVADGDASHVLVIESGFEASVAEGGEQGLRLIRDPGREMEDRLIQLGITQAMFSVRGGDYWSTALRQQFADAGMPDDQLDRFSDQADRMTQIIDGWVSSSETNPLAETDAAQWGFFGESDSIKTEDVAPPSRPKRVTYQLAQSVAGVSVMMLMFGMASCGTTLLTERDEGTLSRLLSSSVPRGTILGGKVTFTFIIGMLQMLVMLLYGELVFRVGVFRDPITLLVISAVWTLAATSLGMLIASFSRTRKQAESMTPIISLTLASLGGCMFPLQLLDLPAPVEMLTKSMVTYWSMSAFQGYFWDAMSLANSKMLFAVAVQLAFATVMMSVASLLFRRNFLRG